MSLPTLFDTCKPRPDVLAGTLSEAEFAADLAMVLRGTAPPDYAEPARFFANTHPTAGLRELLRNICLRLNGSSEQLAAIFRLDTGFGGGKTHALIALAHAVRGMAGVADVAEFIDPALLPGEAVRVAAFDGENADFANGRSLGDGLRAYTPWGELAFALAGHRGYELVRRSDEQRVAPGAATLAELFAGGPALILLDELAAYLRKLKARDRQQAGEQLTAFLTALFKAIESTPRAAVVYTLAIGKEGDATDAYSEENRDIAERMTEMESVSARKATLLCPTADDETVQVLRRRLFAAVDDARAAPVIEAYASLWQGQRAQLPDFGINDVRVERFRVGFPLHPELIELLCEKTATLVNFQRVRGMLRLLARTIACLWQQRPRDTFAIHTHHIDLSVPGIRQEIVTRMQQGLFLPAIKADVGATIGDHPALAQRLDAEHYAGLPPYGSWVARTVLMHSLAFNDSLKGLGADALRYALLSPATDAGFIDDARTRFVQQSAYLDDRPNAPLRFLTEANLTQLLRAQEHRVDPADVRAGLNDRLRSIYRSGTFNLIAFPAGSYDVADDAGDGKPWLVVPGYDAVEVSAASVQLPDLVRRIYLFRGNGSDFRINRNNLMFLVVDAGRCEEMRRRMTYRLALEAMRKPDSLRDLPEHQQQMVLSWYQTAEQRLALAIQQAYRHVFYPSGIRADGFDVDLAHSVIEVQTASESPGAGQRAVARVLTDNRKLRLPEDEPDSPTYIRDRTPLRKGELTMASLREEFRRNPRLPMLIGNDVFLRGIRNGIESGDFVYRHGDLLYGPGDPWADLRIDEQALLMTMTRAEELRLWPRRPPEPPPPPPPPPTTIVDTDDPDPSGKNPTGAGGGTGPVTPPVVPPPPAGPLAVEGVLREALVQLWEQARARRYVLIRSLTLRLFDATDALRLIGLAGTVPKADKRMKLSASYATAGGSECQIEFTGSLEDVRPLRDFLDPQLRAATERDLSLDLTLTFTDGLLLAGDAPERFAEQLTRAGSGTAHVTATAEGQA